MTDIDMICRARPGSCCSNSLRLFSTSPSCFSKYSFDVWGKTRRPRLSWGPTRKVNWKTRKSNEFTCNAVNAFSLSFSFWSCSLASNDLGSRTNLPGSRTNTWRINNRGGSSWLDLEEDPHGRWVGFLWRHSHSACKSPDTISGRQTGTWEALVVQTNQKGIQKALLTAILQSLPSSFIYFTD